MDVLDYKSFLASPEPKAEFQKFTFEKFPFCDSKTMDIFDVLDTLKEEMWPSFEKAFSEKIIEIKGFVLSEEDKVLTCRCIVFFHSKKFALVDITMDKALVSWIKHFVTNDAGKIEKDCVLFHLRTTGCESPRTFLYRKLLTNPSAAIKEMAPTQFNFEENEQIRQEYYRNYVNFNREIDEDAIRDKWQELVNCYDLKTNEGLNTSTCESEFKELVGFELPEEIKIVLSMSDGCRFRPSIEFLSFNGILSEWQVWKNVEKTWTLEQLQEYTMSDGEKTLNLYCCPFYVPITTDGGGNGFALDFCPGKQGQSGQVIAIGRDQDRRTQVASNLQEFLQKLIEQFPKK